MASEESWHIIRFPLSFCPSVGASVRQSMLVRVRPSILHSIRWSLHMLM